MAYKDYSLATNYQRQFRKQAASVGVPPHLPLVTTIQSRDASFDRDARLVNTIVELNPVSEEYWVEKRLGLEESEALSGAGGGIYNWRGVVYSVFGSTLYKDGVPLGTVDATNGKYVFEEMLGTGWLVLNNGVAAYYTDGTTLTEFATYLEVLSGAFLTGSTYEIVSGGTTDFTAIGAANSNPGTVFTATGPGERSDTGTAALVAGSFLVGTTYEIRTVGTTDFTLIGASANTIGVVFTATGAGTGTGTVLSPNFPSSFVKGWAYLDGTLYVMNSSNQIFGTSTLMYGGIGGLDDPRVWDQLNLVVARTEPGEGVALMRYLSYVIAFKSNSTEPFYDAEAPVGSPLKSVQGSHSIYGCVTADSIQSIDGKILWAASNIKVSPQVAMLEDLKVRIVSTPPVERLLKGIDGDQVLSWALKHGGHRLYGLTMKNLNVTLVYDLDQNLWYFWTDADENYWPIIANTFNSDSQTHLAQHETNGKIYLVDGCYVYPSDDGDIFPVDIYTPNFDGEVKRRKHLGAMLFDCDQEVGSKLFVRSSDDDHQTWTNFREVDLGQKNPMLTNCGTFTRRAWHIRHLADKPFRIKAVGLQMDLGTL